MESATADFQETTSITNKIETTGITETDYDLNTSYYEFKTLWASGLVITVTEAQVRAGSPDQQKRCEMVIPTIEVNENNGTFESYPQVTRPVDYASQRNQTLNRLNKIKKLKPVFSAGITLQPTNSQNDVTLCEHLQSRFDDFIFWPNGGQKTQTNDPNDYVYRFDSKPFRLQDVYKCQTDDGALSSYLNNISVNMVNMSFGVREVV